MHLASKMRACDSDAPVVGAQGLRPRGGAPRAVAVPPRRRPVPRLGPPGAGAAHADKRHGRMRRGAPCLDWVRRMRVPVWHARRGCSDAARADASTGSRARLGPAGVTRPAGSRVAREEGGRNRPLLTGAFEFLRRNQPASAPPPAYGRVVACQSPAATDRVCVSVCSILVQVPHTASAFHTGLVIAEQGTAEARPQSRWRVL